MSINILTSIPSLEGDELLIVQETIKELNDDQKKNFVMLYQGRRKDPQTILLCTLLGFIVVAGVQRFMLGQMGMGILYLFTGGLCVIGTIVDLVNYKKLTLEFNQRVAVECKVMSTSF